MFMIPALLLVFMGMYELFTITFGAQNAHIRAREYVLHSGEYTRSAPANEPATGLDRVDSNGPLFESGNYVVADKDIWGLASAPGGGGTPNFGWKAAAHDQGIVGVATSSDDRGEYVKATAYICSPIGCPK
jgi:hypothetical protein